MIYIRFETPSQGLWNVRVFPEADMASMFHMWLPMRELMSGEVIFVRSNPDTTLTVPATAIVPVSVGLMM